MWRPDSAVGGRVPVQGGVKLGVGSGPVGPNLLVLVRNFSIWISRTPAFVVAGPVLIQLHRYYPRCRRMRVRSGEKYASESCCEIRGEKSPARGEILAPSP